ncbi:hypothetical protein Tco_0538476, partial [Tanacetum coccineum]
EDETHPIPTISNPDLINSNSPTVSPFPKDSTEHTPYAKKFANGVLPNHVGDKEFKSIGDTENGVLTKKEIKKDDMRIPKEPNKEWKLNDKVVPHNENDYHYQ